jgi:hypothetical protein
MNALRLTGLVSAALLLGVSACGDSGENDAADGGPVSVLSPDAGTDGGSPALTEFTLTWPQGPTGNLHDFTNMHLVAGANGPYSASFSFFPVNSRNPFGHSNTGWFMSIAALDPSQTTNSSRFLNVAFGWESAYFHEWFGEGPANFVEIDLYDSAGNHHNYCYALGTATDTFVHPTAHDSTGAYVDFNIGPLTINEGTTFNCEGTPPFHQAGAPSIRIKYRCPTDGRQLPDFACR